MARMNSVSAVQPAALTAAITVVRPSDVSHLSTGGGGRSYWRYYRELPDVRYTANLAGRLLSMSTPRLERRGDAGAWERVPDAQVPPEVVGALTAIYDSPGGLEDISRRFAQQYTIDGQCYLVGYNRIERLAIEALSIEELKTEGSGYVRMRGGTTGMERMPATTKVRRIHRRHPQNSYLAETPLEALVGDMDTLIALNSALRARVRSRLAAAGIVFLPNSITVAAPAERPDGTDQALDEVTRKIIEAMSAAISNPDSPEAVMPIVVRGPDESGERIQHITLDRMIDETEMLLRSELRENILQGLDAPKNIADYDAPNVNHWNQASVKMEMWEHTVAPVGDILWEGLTQLVLNPWLQRKGVSGDYRWRVDRDSVQIRNNQDEKTRAAVDRTLIGDSAARRRLGIPEGDAPTKVEYIRMVGRHLGIPELAFYKMEVEGVDLSTVGRVKRGPAPTGTGREIPDDVVSDTPDDRDRRVR